MYAKINNMNYLSHYFIVNFPLLCASLGMIFIAIYDFRVRKNVSIWVLSIIGVALTLSILSSFEEFFKDSGNIVGATICVVFGYTLRPLGIVFFIYLSGGLTKKTRPLLLIPIGIVFLVYGTAFFIGTPLGKAVFHFSSNDSGGVSYSGSVFSNTSHVVGALLLVFLLFISIKDFSTRHTLDTLAIIACAVFVVAAVLIETLTDTTNVLNNTIAISCVFYYLFILNSANRRDVLSTLLNRSSYYADVQRFGRIINAVIHIDMNGLKILNDTKGHEEGDNAINTLGRVIAKNLTKKMYAYRIGGDEFVVLCLDENENVIKGTIEMMRGRLKETPYSASFGYSMKTESTAHVDQLVNAAEKEMYKDKKAYYKSNNIERRKQD